MVETQQPKAIPFIAFNQKESSKSLLYQAVTEFEINEEAVQFVAKIEGPIGVCSVAGMYRTGKSYLLNRMLLDRSNGFGVGPTINACTKGLWIWNEVVSGTTPDGDPISVLVVDTEGLGAFDETQNHDVRIFTLAILLSSYFLYNSMGSIDETSLNQLSLVVNLTKHIQLTASGCRTPGDVDPEEYSKIFPSFMWVVRDFALKLTDENDTSITSKEYLERALLEQKGFSDSVEQKNRIRRLLKTFFTERDCCTMIRPVSNEAELQNLAQKDVSELRPEFQEQVKILRRKVLGKIKPKTLNGKLLTGSIIMNLAQQYVDSINRGAVPNIESAWTYICQNECQKATEESVQIFKQSLDENVKLPCDDETIFKSFKISQKAAFAHFDSKVFGQDIKIFRAALKEKLQQIKGQFQQQNIWETHKVVSQFLSEQFQPIEISLRQGEIETFGDYKLCMQEFVAFVEAQSPAGQGKTKSEAIREFFTTMILQTTDHFCANFSSTNKVQLAIQEEKIKFVELRNQEMKNEHASALESLRLNQRTLEKEKAELLAHDSQNKLTLQSLNEETKRLKNLNETQVAQLKQEYSQQLEQKEQVLQHKVAIAQDAQRQLYSVQSEGEKQIALLEQRLEFLNSKQLELERKLGSVTQEKDQIEKSAVESVKQIQSSFDAMKFELAQRQEEQQEKLFEAASQLAQVEEEAKTVQAKLQNLNQQLEQRLVDALEDAKILTQKVENIGSNNNDKVVELQTKLAHEIHVREQVEATNKASFIEMQEFLGSKVKDLEKEYALLEQKWMFGKEENQTLQRQLVERSQAHESILKALEDKSNEHAFAKETALQKLSTITNEHSQALEDLKRTFECQFQQQQQQINELTDVKANLETRIRIESQESVKQLQVLETQLALAEKSKDQMEASIKLQERSQADGLSKANENFNAKIAALESEIEELTNQQEATISDMQVKAEEQLQNLKQMYESERHRLETRLSEEKEASRKKHQLTIEEYETRIRDEQLQREEDIEMLQSDIKENENRHQNNIKQLEFDNQLLHQTLQTNAEQSKEQEERLQRELHIANQQLQLSNDRLQKERQESQQKVQDLLREDAQKEQQIASLTVNVQTLKEQIESAKDAGNETLLKSQAESERAQIKIEEQKTKVQQLQDELLRQQLDSSREIALFKQRVDFQEKKIEDLNKQLETTVQNYEERLRLLKADSHQEQQEIQARFTAQFETLEAKFEVKRKKLKEQEQSLLKKCTDVQKDKDVVDQQLQNAVTISKQQTTKFEAEIQGLNEQVSRLQDQVQSEREQFQSEIDRSKHQLNDIERDYCELQNNSERDKALLEGKCQFLEQQRDQAKSDYLEASRKFESTLEQLQKRGSQEKDRTETSQSAMLTSLELKFKKQLQEQIDEKQKLQYEHEEKTNTLQKQLRDLITELKLSERDRQTMKKQLEVKDQEWTIKEQELRQLLENSQNDKDSKSSNYLRTLERDREHLKQKFSEMESKIKENERNKTSLLFEVEKEKAKWAMEREQQKNRVSELNDTIEGLERQKENLLKENEKLKSQSKKSLLQPKVSAISGMRSPIRYGGQSSITPTHNFEPSQLNSGLSKSIFISGMSRALLGNQSSDTSSQHSLDLASITAPIQLKSTFDSKTMSNAASTQKSGRVNVINFDLTRTKARLSNITNTIKKPLDDQETM